VALALGDEHFRRIAVAIDDCRRELRARTRGVRRHAAGDGIDDEGDQMMNVIK
jgi:hypothetical protein